MCDKCLLKYGFSWTSRAGRAGLWGESLPNDTLRQKWECQAGQHWPDSLCPGATSPARGRSILQYLLLPAALLGTPGSHKHYLFLRLSPSGAFYPMLLFEELQEETQPPQKLFAVEITFYSVSTFRWSLLQCAGFNFCFCAPETMKMAKQTLNRPEGVTLAGREVAVSCDPCSYNSAGIKDSDANLMSNIPKGEWFLLNWDEWRITTFHVWWQSEKPLQWEWWGKQLISGEFYNSPHRDPAVASLPIAQEQGT